MIRISYKSKSQVVLIVAGVALVVAAILRGNYLFGLYYGIVCGFITAFLASGLASCFPCKDKASLSRLLFGVVLTASAGVIMAFPAAINPEIQYFIDKQAIDRTVRAELHEVFVTDSAFEDLSISSVHLKKVNVTIHGKLPARGDLIRLHENISRLPSSKLPHILHWEIELRDSGETIVDLDKFLSAEDVRE